MVKSYKLASLTTLLTLCSGLYAMGKNKPDKPHIITTSGNDYLVGSTTKNDYFQTETGTSYTSQLTVTCQKLKGKQQQQEKKRNLSKTTKKPSKVHEVKKKRTKSKNKTDCRWKKQIIYSIKFNPFKKLIINGCLSNNSEKTPILTINFKPSVHKRPTLECTKSQFHLIKKFLTIENKSIKSIFSSLTEVEKRILNNEEKLRKLLHQNKKDERLEISTKGDNNLEWFKKFKKYCEFLKISPKLFVTLCIPKDWEVHINGKNTNIIGYLSNKIESIDLENCKVSLSGESNDGLYFLENSKFNQEDNDSQFILNGKIGIYLDNSYFRCWANPKNYSEGGLIKNGLRGGDYHVVSNPLKVSGSARNNSTTCFDTKYTSPNFIKYDETSESTCIPDQNCIRS